MKEKLMVMVDVALGRIPAQLVLKNANLVNVFTGEIYPTDIAIHMGYVAGLGEYHGAQEIDCTGKFVTPGLIDAHVHIESAMVTPDQFAKAILPRGTTTVIADPHEIANVAGIPGIAYLMESAENLPLNVLMMLPSCVPATPFENSGADLKAEDLAELMAHPKVMGLGEVMDTNSVLNCRHGVFDKIVLAKKANKQIDGHSPGLAGKDLTAYIMAGIRSDHETVNVEEARERLRLGATIMLREGSQARNVKDLLPVVTPETQQHCFFCSDDKHPSEILSEGHIDHNVRLAIAEGLDPVTAIRMATINPAKHFGIPNVGAVAPGYKADLLIVDDLTEFRVEQIFKKGRLVAKDGTALFETEPINDSSMRRSVKISPLSDTTFDLPPNYQQLPVIGINSFSLLTDRLEYDETKRDSYHKITVIERHHATGSHYSALIAGFGDFKGAIASTVAHDSHNIVVLGANDEDMRLAVETLRDIGGGLTLILDHEIIGSLPLPIAGLMSDRPVQEVNDKLEQLKQKAYQLGVTPDIDPFMTLQFMALPVIPDLKITDIGLFDVTNFEFIR
ncbi:MAG TPA: adenine deaminase [Tissierellia bacterium]|nr:adenine deaminase [Tissierellia bacterium]